MAAAGKKSKKAKWISVNITDILAEPTTIPTTNNWADSVDEEPENFGYASRSRAPVVLPSASRAARGGMAVDDDAIPRRPPFIAHISNLPYDVDESAITELFDGLKNPTGFSKKYPLADKGERALAILHRVGMVITSLRLPREGDRLKGYGYVDFEDRESLINAMNIADLTIGGRRIRIDVSTQDNDRRRMGGRSDRDRDYDPERTMGDWRSGPRAQPEPQARSRNMDREGMGSAPPGAGGPGAGMRDRDRGGDRDRDRDRDRERDSSADNRPGGWRDGDRPAPPPEPARTPYGGRDSYGRDRYGDREDRGGGRERGYGRDGERSGYGGRDGFRTAERDGGGFGSRENRGFGGRGFGDRDRDRDPPPREDAKPRERPKLNLLPRTVPRETETPTKPADGAPLDDKAPEKAVPKPVPAEKVFGAAKPVDTAAKEREIEERLRKQEEESRRGGEDKERWGRRNDNSGDRRGGARREDRGRDSRSYNTDRRDYSKDDRDRRDYSKDDKDRRERDDRDDRDRREPRDQDRRQSSGERRDSRDRDIAGEREPAAREREPAVRDERNGRPRPSRSRDRHDDEEEDKLPKMKEQEKPNFVASNKFSFLEDADDGASD